MCLLVEKKILLILSSNLSNCCNQFRTTTLSQAVLKISWSIFPMIQCEWLKLRCYSRLAMHEGLISNPPYNGWLATSMVCLPKCTKLTAYWKTNQTLLLQKKFRFSPFVQKQRKLISVLTCRLAGHNQNIKNSTTSRDGWELVLFDPCYWTIIRPEISARPMCHGRITSW